MSQANSNSTCFEEIFSGLSPRERNRLSETLSIVPSDIESALEIGFMDFRVTRALSRFVNDVVSVDLPHEVTLKPAGFKLVFSSISSLPFRDQAFDLIVCTEVLEHLNDVTLQAGINELRRVSSKYLLVTVPYKQRVWNELYKCSACGYEENCMGHLRYVDDNTLRNWFPNWEPLVLRTMGVPHHGCAPDWIYALSRRVGNVWFDYWTDRCPKCRALHSCVTDNYLGFLLRRIIWRLEISAPSKPAWLLSLFRRRT